MSQVQALTPQQAKALAELMTAQGVLEREAVSSVSEAAVPSIFGPSEPTSMQVRHDLHIAVMHSVVYNTHAACADECFRPVHSAFALCSVHVHMSGRTSSLKFPPVHRTSL